MDEKCLVCHEDFEAMGAGAIETLTDAALERINFGVSLVNEEGVSDRTVIVAGAGKLVDDEELRWALKQYLGDHRYEIERLDSTSEGFESGRVVSVLLTTAFGEYRVNLDSPLASLHKPPDGSLSRSPGTMRRTDF